MDFEHTLLRQVANGGDTRIRAADGGTVTDRAGPELAYHGLELLPGYLALGLTLDEEPDF